MNNFSFRDIFTDFTCSLLLRELTKFILYSKQQIPITYDKLHLAVDNYNCKGNVQKFSYQAEKLLKQARQSIQTLEEIFDQISSIVADDTQISEVAFLFGGSIMTPRQVYHFHLPQRRHGHLPKYHAKQAIMTELLQHVVNSADLNQLLSKHLEPTNLFFLFKFRGEKWPESWFVPRPRYQIPTNGQKIHINLFFESEDCVPCSCKGFQFYSEEEDSREISPTATRFESRENQFEQPTETWHQVPLVFKGFKDIYVQGVSVSKIWMNVDEDLQNQIASR